MKFQFILIVIYYIHFCISQDEVLLKVGCFDSKDIVGFTKVSGVHLKKSASSCVSHCRSVFKVFAGIQNGDICMCGEYYSGIDVDLCNITCQENRNETCGGPSYISIYETAKGALGAPRSLRLISSSENAIHVSWKPPASKLADMKHYNVVVKAVYYFNELLMPLEKYYKYSPLTQAAFLDGLLPGTKYNITVVAVSEAGDGFPASVEGWTKVGRPPLPKIPQLLSRTPTTMIVEIEPIDSSLLTGGPISSYQIIVVDETLPVIIDFDLLDSYNAAAGERLPYYIAAEILPDHFETVFTVGDKKYYGNYYNAPLRHDKDYHILLGVISTINETKASYSESVHSQHEGLHTHIEDENSKENVVEDLYTDTPSDPNHTIIMGLSIAVGFFAFLLIASVFVYFGLRVHFRRNSLQSIDHQELAVHAHIPNQDYENGFIVGTHYVDDEELQPDYYRCLREKVQIYPHQSISAVADIGVGKYGEVKKGILHNCGNEQVNTLVQRIQDNSLSLMHKSEMLKEFDMHIKIGKHENVVSLLGLMEELNVISVVFEYETISLKSHILESRALQHYPIYAEKNRRFSTLQEPQVLQILHEVARGMRFISSLHIPHGQLCCRNIVLRDGIHPKICGFGLLSYHNDVYIPDYRRWNSPEICRSKIATCAGDIWSFGCLVWEAVTLGGTPYADIRTDELVTRVARGLRLAQPEYITDELYQLMLLCWQNDPEERPPFSELESIMQKLATDDILPHVLFSLYPAFQYETYSPYLEFVD